MDRLWVVRAAIGLVAVGASLGVTGPAQAAPGTPEDPTVLFSENFENGNGNSAVELADYVGAAPSSLTYTADPYYLETTACNGIIAAYDTPLGTTGTPSDDCHAGSYWPWVRQFAKAIAGGTADSNHALVDFTTKNAVSPSNGVILDSSAGVTLPAEGRYVTFSIDAAEAYCGNGAATQAKLDFFVKDGANSIPTQSTAANPCTESGFTNVVVDGRTFHVGTMTADGSTFVTSSPIGFTIKNQTAVSGGSGNDTAWDNVKMLDVSPQLDQTFTDAVVPTGGSTTLTYTITNTSELASKENFGFVNTLPLGLVATDVTTTCGDGAASVTGSNVALTGGDLAAGDTSCTVTVTVTAPDGTYTNDGETAFTTTGLDEPATESVTFSAVVDIPVFDPIVTGAVALIALTGVIVIIRRRRTGSRG